MNAFTKIFVWSLIFEPLLYFFLGHPSVTGVGANISRILQIFVVMTLLLRWAESVVPSKALNPLNRHYVFYAAYILLACMAGLYGALTGGYTVSADYNSGITGIGAVLRSAGFRPFFEYVIAIYYFVYFCVLPQYLLKSDEDIRYFFKAFFFAFNTSLVLGLIDYVVSFWGVTLIGRSLYESVEVPHRFHGFAGEPRDAFVYLILGLALSYLRAVRYGYPIRIAWLAAVVIALVFTQSASGVLGIVIFLGLWFLHGATRLNKYVLISSLCVTVLAAPIVYVLIESSQRLLAYKDVLLIVWDILETRQDVPILLMGQMNNIYPVYHLVEMVRDGNLVPLLIGSGFGSASAINTLTGIWNDLTNPHAQLIRLLYETGLTGLTLFVLAFYYPVYRLTRTLQAKQRRIFFVFTFLILGASLAHRSVAPYLFLGIAIAVLRPASRSAAADSRGNSSAAVQQSALPIVEAPGH
jgi:hypothetical protein